MNRVRYEKESKWPATEKRKKIKRDYKKANGNQIKTIRIWSTKLKMPKGIADKPFDSTCPALSDVRVGENPMEIF